MAAAAAAAEAAEASADPVVGRSAAPAPFNAHPDAIQINSSRNIWKMPVIQKAHKYGPDDTGG